MIFLFSGKGGVGKTTLSAAFALFLAQSSRTLIVSTDPAHSLSDIFGLSTCLVRTGGEEKGVGERLWALELDPEQALTSYKETIRQRYGSALRDSGLELSAFLDSLDLNPGTYEAAILDAFFEQLFREDMKHVVFDTAPTASTLRMLFASEQLKSWFDFLVETRKGIARIRELLHRPDPLLGALQQMRQRFEQVASKLRAPTTHFFVILNPDALSLYETQRLVRSFEALGLPLRGLILNRVISESLSPQLARSQYPFLKAIRERFGAKLMEEIPLFDGDLQGPDGLRRLFPFMEPLAKQVLKVGRM